MNTQSTPRPFPIRSVQGGGSNQPPRQKQPLSQQVAANDEYGGIPDEDREHIDEVVSLYATGCPILR